MVHFIAGKGFLSSELSVWQADSFLWIQVGKATQWMARQRENARKNLAFCGVEEHKQHIYLPLQAHPAASDAALFLTVRLSIVHKPGMPT